MDYGKLALKRIEELYSAVSEMRTEKTASDSAQGISEVKSVAETEFSRTLRFNVAEESEITLSLKARVDKAVSVAVSLDGQILLSNSYPAGALYVEVTCSSVSSGRREATVVIAGDDFTVYDFSLKATGKLSFGSSAFIEAFSDGSGYISLCDGVLELYGYSDGCTSLSGTLSGIKYARAFTAVNKKYIAAVTETGLACVISADGDLSGALAPLCAGAVAAAGVYAYDGIADVFVVTGQYLLHYSFDTETDTATYLEKAEFQAEELTALRLGGKAYLISGSKGFLTVRDALPATGYDFADTFNLSFGAEV